MTILRASCTALAALGMLSSAACMTNSKGDMIREYLDCQAERDPYFEESVMIISPLPWTCRTPRTSRSTSATPLPWTIRRRPGTRCAGVIVAAALAAQGEARAAAPARGRPGWCGCAGGRRVPRYGMRAGSGRARMREVRTRPVSGKFIEDRMGNEVALTHCVVAELRDQPIEDQFAMRKLQPGRSPSAPPASPPWIIR